MSTFRRATLRAASAALAVASVFLLATCDLSTLTQPSGTIPGGGPVFDSTELAIGGGRSVTLGGTVTMTVTSPSVSLSNVVKRYYSASPTILTVDSLTGLVTGVGVGPGKVTAKILAPELGAGVTISQVDTVKYKGIKVTTPLASDSIAGLGQTRLVTVFGLNNSSVQVGTALTIDSVATRNATIVTASGLTVTAKKNGTAYVVAFFKGLSDSVAVRVRQVAKTITFPTTDYTARHVNFNLTVPLTVKDVADSIIPAPTITWQTKDTTKAVIGSTTGLLKVKAVGITDSVFATVDTVKRGQKIIVSQVVGSLSKFQGDARSDTVAQNVSVVPIVTALDSGLTPVAGASVKFKTGLGFNAVVVDTLPVTTDGTGKVGPTSWKLGDVAGTNNNTLIATSGAQTTTFTVSGVAGQPKKLGFLVQPTSVAVSTAIAPSIQVQIQDSLGNVIATATNTVTLSLSNNPGAATLGGTLSQPAVAGVATFNNITLSAVGSGYTLLASSGTLQAAVSNGVDAFGGKTKLGFSTQPSGATAGAIAPTVRVQVQDAGGNKVATATDSVTLAIGTNPAAGTLSGTLKTAAVAGVATFTNLSINNSGTGYTLNATAPGLTLAASTAFNVAAVGSPAKVSFLSQPSNVVSGSSMTSFAVQIQDASGAVVTSSTAQVTLSIDPTTIPNGVSVSVSGNPTVAASAGVATFNNLIVNRAGTGYKLIATVTGLTTATSSTFNVTAGTATKLGFFQAPTHTVVGTTISPAVVVEVQDANGNRVTTGAVPISLALGSCLGALSGGGAATTANGIATYSGLSVSATGSNCFLAVTTTAGLSSINSTTFNVVAVGGAVRLKFTTQPASSTAGVALNAGIVAVQDGSGNNVGTASASVTIAVASGPTTSFSTATGNPLTAAPTASFTSATFNTAGTYQLVATATGYRPDTSTAFTISPAAANRANLITFPSNGVAGTPLSTTAQAAIQDALGNTVTSASGTMTLSAFSCPSGCVQEPFSTGTTVTAPIVSGVATFTGVKMNKAATAIELCAAGPGVSSLCTAQAKWFDVTAAPLSRLAFNVQPATATIVTTFPTAPQVSGQDSVGNTLTDFTGNVTVALTGGTAGAALSGSKTVAAVLGVASFPGLSIDKSGTGYQLSASASGVSTGTSSAFTVNAGAATKLGWITQPAATTFFNAPLSAAGATLATIAVQDAAGNTVVSSNGQTIRLAVSVGPSTTFKANGSSVTTADFTTVNGVVALTANNLSMTTAGTGYQLLATSPFNGFTSSTSTAFQVLATDVKSKLAWNNNPQNGTYGVALLGPSSNTPNVFVVDAYNNLIGSATDNITVSIGTDANPTTTLSGGGSTAAAGGGASFPSLTLDKTGTGFTLVAAATGLTSATSTAFNITAPGLVASGITNPAGLIRSGTDLYFTEVLSGTGTVKKVSTIGGAITTFASSLNQPWHLTTDGTNIYWLETAGGSAGLARIMRQPIAGGASAVVISGLTVSATSQFLEYDSATQSLFYIVGNTIKKIAASATNGSPAAADFMVGSVTPFYTIDNGNVYFRSVSNDVRKLATSSAAGLAGSTVLATGLASSVNPSGINGGMIVVGSAVFFTDDASVYSLPTAGGVATSRISGLSSARGMVSDGTSLWVNSPATALNKYTINLSTSNWSATQVASSTNFDGSQIVLDAGNVFFFDGSSRITKIPK